MQGYTFAELDTSDLGALQSLERVLSKKHGRDIYLIAFNNDEGVETEMLESVDERSDPEYYGGVQAARETGLRL